MNTLGQRGCLALLPLTLLWATAALGQEEPPPDPELGGEPAVIEAEVAGEAEASALVAEVEAPLPPPAPQPLPPPAVAPSERAEEAAPEPVEEAPESEGQNCLGQGEARWVYHQLLVLKYNPLGAEHNGRVGVCAPFIRGRGMLFDLSNFEFGLVHSLSPAYFHLGGYFQFAPFSFLIFRAEATGLMYYEFPLDRAAYFPVRGYDDSIDPDDYPPEQGQTTSGWNINLYATLQARVGLGRLGLIVLDSFSYEFWRVGSADYYINLRHDVIMRGYDTLIANEGMLMLEIPVHPTFDLRVGAYDALRIVPGSGQANNNVGALAMLSWPTLGRTVRQLALFLRVGWYTNRPPQDRGPTVIYLGLIYNFDMASARAVD